MHYPHHSQVITEPAPEPRDVVWKHVAMSPREFTIRNFVVMGVMILLLLTWIGESPTSDSYDLTIFLRDIPPCHTPHQVLSTRTPAPHLCFGLPFPYDAHQIIGCESRR